MNEILCKFYDRCRASNIYTNDPILKKEPVEIKEKLQVNIDGFSTSDGWLDRWKRGYAIKKRQFFGESRGSSEETISS